MITTILIETNPVIIHHQISGEIDEVEAKAGASDAINVIKDIASTANGFMLLLDIRGAAFADLKAHKEWSIGFKEKEVLKKLISKVALVSDNTSEVKNEKKLMESESLKYFILFEEAVNWLKNAKR